MLGAPSPKFFNYTKENGLEARLNPFCERFLDRRGNYGVYGKVISDHLNSKYRANRTTPMLADDVVGMVRNPSVCPNWRNLTTQGRIRFWVWTFAAISSVETSCGLHPRTFLGVKGVDGTAIGLVQINKELKHRSWRGLPTCNVTPNQIAQSPYNLRCGIDIMETIISGTLFNKQPTPVYRNYYQRYNYWQELIQPKGGKIGKLMRNFTPCFEGKTAHPSKK